MSKNISLDDLNKLIRAAEKKDKKNRENIIGL